MQRLAAGFVIMATAVAEQGPSIVAGQNILDLPMLSSTEIAVMRDTWNNTAPMKPYPTPQSVTDTVLGAMSGHSGASLAVEEADSGLCYSYIELIKTISYVASGIHIISKKEQPRIALVFNRGFAMYVSLLGVLSAGGCIVPIDASNTPLDRTLFMLKDAEADVIIFDGINKEFVHQIKERSKSEHISALFISYDKILEDGKETCMENMNMRPMVSVDSVAYILYTR